MIIERKYFNSLRIFTKLILFLRGALFGKDFVYFFLVYFEDKGFRYITCSIINVKHIIITNKIPYRKLTILL